MTIGPGPINVFIELTLSLALRKVDFVLEELGLSYETIFPDTDNNEHKQAPYTDINPNGRLPALIDHKNGDFAIWESNAIVLYLVDKYDTEKRISVSDEKERYQLIQWLFFQASGQGCVFPFRALGQMVVN